MESSCMKMILKWPVPCTCREIQVFLGFTNFYRRFIANYSKIANPLIALLKGSKNGKKTGPYILTKEAKEAFRKLKAAFAMAPVLQHFDLEKPIRIEADASGFAVAAILSQPGTPTAGRKSDAHWHPVAFWSRKMTPAERNYDTHDQELLAIVKSFKQWRHYLEGSRHPIVVLADHANLRYFMTTKELSSHQARWAERLAAFDFEIQYRKGSTNPADGPSRRLDYEPPEGENELLLPTLQLKLRVNSVFKRNRRGDDMEVDSPARPESEMDEGETPVVGKDRSTDVLVDAATRKLSALCPENAASSGTARLESAMGEGKRCLPGVDEKATTLRRGNGTNPDAGTRGTEHLV